MSNLSNAIDELAAELAAFNQGAKQQPRDGSTEWFLLRAKTCGMAYLKRLAQLGVESDAGACERVYKVSSKVFKAAEVPPEPEVVKELLPGDVAPSAVLQ